MNTNSIISALARVNEAMRSLEQELNQADARLGDGDTGAMLARVIDKMTQSELAAGNALGTNFSTLARAALAGTGSSLGTLFATGLLSFAKATQDRMELPAADFSQVLAAARDAMIARGGAKLGDKTVLDSLDAIVRATSGLDDDKAVAVAAAKAASEALAAFRDKPCKIGRARMFGERTIGIDDPGMLAIERVANVLV